MFHGDNALVLLASIQQSLRCLQHGGCSGCCRVCSTVLQLVEWRCSGGGGGGHGECCEGGGLGGSHVGSQFSLLFHGGFLGFDGLQFGLVVGNEVLVGLPVHGAQFDDLQEPVAGSKAETVIAAAGAEVDVAFVQLVC